jgi:general secretion pathway protein D
VLSLVAGAPVLAADTSPLPAPATAPPAAIAPATSVDTATPAAPEGPRVRTFPGTDRFVGSAPNTPVGTGAAAGDITLDFADAEVRDVARAVLGEMLQLPYAVDPQVQGRITLKTGSPIARTAVLPALEAALKMANSAIVFQNGMYNIVPLTDAQRRAAGALGYGRNRSQLRGYGIEIVPLKYIAAAEIQKILEPLAPQGGIVRIDSERNLIFLAGNEPERRSMRETIALFDVNYLRSMSFALIQPNHVDVGTLAAELNKIFESGSSPIAGMVRLIPISRINTLLVATSRASYLNQVKRWIARLDVPPNEPGRRLYYYRLQNAQARDVAQVLAQLYGSAAPAAAPTATAAPTGATTPGELPVPTPVATPVMPAITASTGSPDAPQFVTDDANNALIIRASQSDYASIERIVREMDVAPDQVLIEVTIVEVSLTDGLKYGVEWFFKNADQTYTQSPDSSGAILPNFPGFAFTYNVPNVQVVVNALGNLTRINVISSPKLLTLDNKPATLEVGDQVPTVTQTSVSTTDSSAPLVSTVQMRDTGVIMSVTPRIGKSGMVFLDISQEVSNVIPTTTSGIDSPTIQQRKITSTVAIRDGESVALGGLMRRSETSGNLGIPYLKDIPLIGSLFGSNNNSREKTELIIFLTPRIIRDPNAARRMTDELAGGLGDLQESLSTTRLRNRNGNSNAH